MVGKGEYGRHHFRHAPRQGKPICIERDEDYAAKAIERIRNHVDDSLSTVVPFRIPANFTAEQRAALLWLAAAA